MDYQVDTGLPGGDSFYNVTQMFADAAAGKTPTRPLYVVSFILGPQDMPSGGLVLEKDFTLQDAMAAFEVGSTLLGHTRHLRIEQRLANLGSTAA